MFSDELTEYMVEMYSKAQLNAKMHFLMVITDFWALIAPTTRAAFAVKLVLIIMKLESYDIITPAVEELHVSNVELEIWNVELKDKIAPPGNDADISINVQLSILIFSLSIAIFFFNLFWFTITLDRKRSKLDESNWRFTFSPYSKGELEHLMLRFLSFSEEIENFGRERINGEF